MCIPAPLYRGDDSDAVDVPLNDVASQPVVGPHRTLEIYSNARAPIADRGALESRSNCSGFEPAVAELANGETRAIHGDALTILQIAERSANAKLAPGISLPHAFHFAYLLDQSGEHSSLVQRINRHHVFAHLGASDNRESGEPFPLIAVRAIEGTKGGSSESDR